MRGGAMSLGRNLPGRARLALLVLACLTSAGPVRAQSATASVSGVVQDAQGAVVAGASASLNSHTQGFALLTTSDEQGRFAFFGVRPDAYTLRVTHPGFRTLERTN